LIDSLGYWFVARRLKLDLVFTTIINVSLLNIMIDTNAIHSLGHSSQIVKQRCRINAFWPVELSMHGTRCLILLFIVNLEPHSRDLIFFKFLSG